MIRRAPVMLLALFIGAATAVAAEYDRGRVSAMAVLRHGDRELPAARPQVRRAAAAQPEARLAAYTTNDPQPAAKPRTAPEKTAKPKADAAVTGDDDDLRKPLPDFWATLERDVRSAPDSLWGNTKRTFGSAPNLIILGLAYGGSLAIQESGPDSTIEHALHHKDVFTDDWNEAIGVAGNPGTHFGVAGLWYLLGQQQQNDKTYNVGKTLINALIINDLTTLAGQLATYDDAPNGELGTFPSGHTSSTFTLASVMHEAYGPLVGVPLYALGGVVAMERLDDDEHYFSDVIMGGILGLVVGHSVASGHDLEFLGGTVVPYADPVAGASGIAWRREF